MMLRLDTREETLASIYRAAEADIKLKIARAIKSGALGTARYRTRQLAVIQHRLLQLQHEATPKAVALVDDSYGLGVTLANHAIPPSLLKASFSGGIHDQAVDVLAANLTDSLDAAVQYMGRQVNDVFRQEQLKAAALQFAEGATRKEASKVLADELSSQAIKSFVDRRGAQWDLSTYSRMAIRTVSRQAASEGTRNRLLEHDLDLVTWVAASDADEVCAIYDGQTFSLDGRTPGFEPIPEMPPLHPNCRCVLTGASENLDIAEQRLAEKPIAA